MIPNRFKRGTVLKHLSCCPCLTMFHVITVQDQNLLDKLSTGDLIAIRSPVPYTMHLNAHVQDSQAKMSRI